jgi:crossover junction endodeoxyribonuclease RuvC
MIILGIDPGIATTGYGVIRKIGSQKTKNRKSLKCLEYGCIKTDSKLAASERLKKIHKKITEIITQHQPSILAVESLYFFKNLKTAIPVSQAKGVILLAAAQKKIPVVEFTPLQVKMVITGYGRAEKKQVQKKIKTLLKLKELPRPDDAADALAIALCYTILKKR